MVCMTEGEWLGRVGSYRKSTFLLSLMNYKRLGLDFMRCGVVFISGN